MTLLLAKVFFALRLRNVAGGRLCSVPGVRYLRVPTLPRARLSPRLANRPA